MSDYPAHLNTTSSFNRIGHREVAHEPEVKTDPNIIGIPVLLIPAPYAE